MGNFSCRGKERRQLLVHEYKIEPVAHLKLINGQKKAKCRRRYHHGSVLYFLLFFFKNRRKGNFYLRNACGKGFFNFIGEKAFAFI